MPSTLENRLLMIEQGVFLNNSFKIKVPGPDRNDQFKNKALGRLFFELTISLRVLGLGYGLPMVPLWGFWVFINNS